jgi:hypothetical protein
MNHNIVGGEFRVLEYDAALHCVQSGTGPIVIATMVGYSERYFQQLHLIGVIPTRSCPVSNGKRSINRNIRKAPA